MSETVNDSAQKPSYKDDPAAYQRWYRAQNTDRVRELAKRYRLNNIEKVKQQEKQFRLNNAEKIAERSRRYYVANSEKVKANSASFREQNPEANREWRAKNSPRLKKYHKQHYEANSQYYKEVADRFRKDNPHHAGEWRKENKDKTCVYASRRRASTRLSVPIWYEDDAVELIYQKCAELNQRFNLKGKDQLCVDHIIPITSDTVSGLHCHANLQLLSKSINSVKHNSYQTDW